jgi:cyanophycin synthetase
VDNVMASIAAVWALGVDWRIIGSGLASFSNDSDNAAGRFNIFKYRGATVIADYGHNPDAMVALVQAVEALPSTRRSVVISGAGDRRDEDIRQQTEILGKAFDEVVLFEDQCQRGRKDGEVIALLRAGLAGASRTSAFSEIYGEFLAIDTAMDKLKDGELCLILVDQVEEAMAHISAKVARG